MLELVLKKTKSKIDNLPNGLDIHRPKIAGEILLFFYIYSYI